MMSAQKTSIMPVYWESLAGASTHSAPRLAGCFHVPDAETGSTWMM